MLYALRYVYRPQKDPGAYSLVLYDGQRVTRKGKIVADKGIHVFHSVRDALSKSFWVDNLVYEGQMWVFTDLSVVPVAQGEEGAELEYWATQQHLVLEGPETVN